MFDTLVEASAAVAAACLWLGAGFRELEEASDELVSDEVDWHYARQGAGGADESADGEEEHGDDPVFGLEFIGCHVEDEAEAECLHGCEECLAVHRN